MANRLSELPHEVFQEILSKSTPEEALIVVQEHFPDYTKDELVSDVKELNKLADLQNEGDLDLNQLSQVAGGASTAEMRQQANDIKESMDSNNNQYHRPAAKKPWYKLW